MMCRIEVHCEAHCAMSMVPSQGLEASSQFGAMLLLLLNGMHYGWFQASFIFDGSTFKLHQCSSSWINHDYKSNVIVNEIGVCQLCQSYFLQLFWRVSILDLSFNVFFCYNLFHETTSFLWTVLILQMKMMILLCLWKSLPPPLKKVCLLPSFRLGVKKKNYDATKKFQDFWLLNFLG
jgi:hypothetical protein